MELPLKDLRSQSLDELKEFMQINGEAAFRAKQVWEWLWKKGAQSIADMSNLSVALRQKLSSQFQIFNMQVDALQKSSDGTIKVRFLLHDGFKIEGVLIPTENRVTACVSSQVGCSLDCKFCATGFLKRERNLEAAEIYDQVKILQEISQQNYGQHLNNIVYMGMGEPLLNYQNVIKSIDLLTGEEGLNMNPQRLTISTAGIAKMMEKLADENKGVRLALSLHSAIDAERSAIMPINETNNLAKLKQALSYWYQKTKLRPTLEYTVIENTNDTEKDAKALIQFASAFPCKVNLIEYNPIALADFKPTAEDSLNKFASSLTKAGILTVVRRSRGKDIDAACGQLVNK